jgi:hypothetical protein
MLCCDVVTRPAVGLLCVSDAMFGENKKCLKQELSACCFACAVN